jgi:hypothetical protein
MFGLAEYFEQRIAATLDFPGQCPIDFTLLSPEDERGLSEAHSLQTTHWVGGNRRLGRPVLRPAQATP